MKKIDDVVIIQNDGSLGGESEKSLVIFKTYADRHGNDITAMSDFFDGYIQQLSSNVKEQSIFNVVSEVPTSLIGVITEVANRAEIIMRGKTTLIPDLENLPADVKMKLKKGIYKIGDSKQVDGNLRAVVLDENNVRVKDITLKKVVDSAGKIETLRSISNQIQMRQILTKLAGIEEFQTYQLERDRDRDFIVPFLDARSLVLEAETVKSKDESIQLLKEADGKIRSALNAIYVDVETTSRQFEKLTQSIFLKSIKQMNTYMKYLVSDLQIATKYVGVRMQLLEYLGETTMAESVLLQYQYVMYDFLTKSMSEQGSSVADLLHDYFPYSGDNRDCWYYFKEEMVPVLKSSIKALEAGTSNKYENDVFIVAFEDIRED